MQGVGGVRRRKGGAAYPSLRSLHWGCPEARPHPNLTLTLVLPTLCSWINLKIEKTADSGRTHWRGARVATTWKMPLRDQAPPPGTVEDRHLGPAVSTRQALLSRGSRYHRGPGVEGTELPPRSSDTVSLRMATTWTQATKTSTRIVRPRIMIDDNQTPACVPWPQHNAGGRGTRQQKELYGNTRVARSTRTLGGSLGNAQSPKQVVYTSH